jgi:hypothetical protein
MNKVIFLLLTIVGGLVIFFYNYQYFWVLCQGDHGRDIYSIQQMLLYKRPYIDFFWEYGPLMLYILAGVCKIFGMSLLNILITKQIFFFR